MSKLVTESIAGTMVFMAPELFNGVIHKKSDIWSMGILIYQLIYQNYPSYVRDEKSIRLFALSDDKVFFPRCPDEYNNLLYIAKKCLAKDVKERSAASDLYNMSLRNWSELLKMIIPDKFVDNSKMKAIQEQYRRRGRGGHHQNGQQGQASGDSSQKRCFICKSSLPEGWKYRRCDKCFKTKCVVCCKDHTPGYKYKTCAECYAKKK